MVSLYSRPRIAQAMAEYNRNGITLLPGYSIDFARCDSTTGRARDLSRPNVQSRVMKLVTATELLFLIGSPPCTVFSAMRSISSEAELKAGR